MKTCTKCLRAMPFESFSKDAQKKDGFRSSCRDCDSARQKQYRINHPNADKERVKAWRQSHPEALAKHRKKWADAHPEKVKVKRKKWEMENAERAKNLRAQWQRENRVKVNFYNAKRRAALLRATPPWLSKDDWDNIAAFYQRAIDLENKTGIKHEVDHIIPLQGKAVCGLHVPWNLQVLTLRENKEKHHHFGEV